MKAKIIVLAAALAVAAALPAAGQPPRGKQAPQKKATGNIVVKLSMEDGTTFNEGVVFLRERTVKLKKAQKALSFLDVPVGTYAPTAEVFVKQGWFKPTRRYLGVVPVRVVKDKSAETEIVLRPVQDIEAFCSPCHPPTGEFTLGAPIQIVRDVHVSGLELGGEYRKQVDVFNKKAKKDAKAGVPHSYPIRLVERGDKVYYTCESCHTPHITTPYGSYAIAGFKENSALCRGCHY
jgi:hypothetical protein